MARPYTVRDYLRDYWAISLLVLLFALGVLLYLAGWRLGQGGMPVRAGELVLEGVPSGTYAYIDQTRRIPAHGGTARSDLTPGSHTVIVDAPGFQPWNELFAIESGKDTVLRPILVPKEPEPRTLHGEERSAGAAAILAFGIPTKAAPLSMEGGCALVYVANGRVLADATTTPECAAPEYLLCPVEEGGARTEACPSSTVIFPATEHIESVSPFPSRDDAVIVAAGGSSFVIELDPREPQFVSPLLKGPRMRAAPWSATSIVISDTKQVYELPL